MALTGCSTVVKTKLVASEIVVPASLKKCPAWPTRPATNKQSAAGKYTNAIAGVGVCWQTKHGAIVTIVEEHNKKVVEINKSPPK